VGRYQEALAEGRTALGVFCCLDGYSVSHIFAAAGYDFVIIDLQHAAYTWPELENMCFRIRSAGASVFLRTASQDGAEINLALDLPIDGLVIPNIASVAQARAALAHTKFPPAGERSLGNERHDTIWSAYSQPDAIIGMLVEHKDAVASIEEIFDLGMQFAWVGLHDLAASMGIDPHSVLHPPNPPEFTAAIERIRAAAQAKGVPYWGPEPGSAATLAAVDARVVRRAADDALAATRARLAAGVPGGVAVDGTAAVAQGAPAEAAQDAPVGGA
jgi:4-hydroxy-2-oxoheptanedioate aldolase